MVEALSIITSIAVVLLVGVVLSVFATRIKIPEILVLILAGIILGTIKYQGMPVIVFPSLFLTSISLLALALIVFDSSVRLRLKEIDTLSMKAIKFVTIFSILSLVLFSLASHFVLGIPAVLAVIFAAINIGTSPDIILSLLSEAKHKVIGILKIESVFNTPLTVLLPFIVVDFTQGRTEVSALVGLIGPFLTKFVVGIGAGVFIGVILFKIMQKKYSPLYSPLAVVLSSLLAYVLAENLGGNGVLSVVVLGVFFGNVYIKEKLSLLGIESVLTKAFFIFVFMILGLIIKIPLTVEFFARSLFLFAAYLLIRYLAVSFSFSRDKLSVKEMLFITLNAPKGISTVAVVFLFAIYNVQGSPYYIPGISIVLDMTLIFILYSIVLSTIVCSMQKYFLEPKK